MNKLYFGRRMEEELHRGSYVGKPYSIYIFANRE